MRVDKYLWCVRYYKTRNQASEACKKGQVRINDSITKPGKEVFISDQITVRKNQINYKLRVLDIPPNRIGAKLVDIYRKDETPSEEFNTQELLKLAKEHYRKKGLGRPTKKDRRDLDEYTDWDDKV
jgi:ribosome-associated heat shock protein Hsp15